MESEVRDTSSPMETRVFSFELMSKDAAMILSALMAMAETCVARYGPEDEISMRLHTVLSRYMRQLLFCMSMEELAEMNEHVSERGGNADWLEQVRRGE